MDSFLSQIAGKLARTNGRPQNNFLPVQNTRKCSAVNNFHAKKSSQTLTDSTAATSNAFNSSGLLDLTEWRIEETCFGELFVAPTATHRYQGDYWKKLRMRYEAALKTRDVWLFLCKSFVWGRGTLNMITLSQNWQGVTFRENFNFWRQGYIWSSRCRKSHRSAIQKKWKVFVKRGAHTLSLEPY